MRKKNSGVSSDRADEVSDLPSLQLLLVLLQLPRPGRTAGIRRTKPARRGDLARKRLSRMHEYTRTRCVLGSTARPKRVLLDPRCTSRLHVATGSTGAATKLRSTVAIPPRFRRSRSHPCQVSGSNTELQTFLELLGIHVNSICRSHLTPGVWR